MLFFVGFFVISMACSVITIKTLVGYSDMKLFYKLMIVAVVLLGWFSFPVIRFLLRTGWMSDQVFAPFSMIAYTLFGFVFILFSMIILRDIVWYLIYGSARLLGRDGWWLNPKNISVLGYANMIVVFLSVALSSYALYEGTRVPAVKEVNIYSPLLKQDLRLVQLSDLHITRTTPVSRVESIVEKINSLNPDAIVMTGDIIDDNVNKIENQLNALAGLAAPYGIYSSMGNHEFYNNMNAWSYKFKQLGFQTLFNKGVFIGNSNVFVSGIPDAHTAYMHPDFNINFKKALEGSSRDNFKILLSHNPEIANSISSFNYQLMLSGHTHGGQIFPFHYLVKKANKYLSGDYKVNGIDLHVSNGAGTWGPSMRLFAPSEIAVVNLYKK